MEMLNQMFLFVHILTGAIALIAAPVALFNQNGRSLHRISGKVFFICMTAVFITSVYLSIEGNIPFLLMIGVFSYYGIATGYRALHLKNLNITQKALWIDWVISGIAALFNSCLIVYGTSHIMHSDSFGSIAVIFGALGLFQNIQMLLQLKNGYKERHGWLFIHISGMTGGYIAALTAFLVNTIHIHQPIILWLSPTAIFLPVIIYTIRKFKKKFKAGRLPSEIITIKIGTKNG